MKHNIFNICFVLLMINLLIGTKDLSAQEKKAPIWSLAVSGWLQIKNDNRSAVFDLFIEDSRFQSTIARSFARHTMIGVGVHTQLEPRFQSVQLGLSVKYFPFTIDRTYSLFVEGSPGFGWNRNRYWTPLGCNICDRLAIHKRWFFYPVLATGLIWRPDMGNAALEIKMLYWPSYDAGPFLQTQGNKLSVQAGFSYWIQPKRSPE